MTAPARIPLHQEMGGRVYCSACDHVHPASRDEQKPWNWRCLRFPRAAGYGFVHPSYSPQPPYLSCRDANPRGECSEFEPRRLAAEEAAS